MSWYSYESVCFALRQSLLFFLVPVHTTSKLVNAAGSADASSSASSHHASSSAEGLNRNPAKGEARARSRLNPPTPPRAEPHVGIDAASRSISWRELSEANHAAKGWVVVRGKVYDLTAFASRHPGGRNLILAAVGRDCTIAFETSHSDFVAKGLRKYHIGQLSEKHELPQFPPRSEFGKEVNRRVKEYFTSTKQDPKHAPWVFVRYAVILVFLSLTYALTFLPNVVSHSLPLQLLSAILFAFALSQVSIHLVHDGSHGSITHSPAVWQAMASLHDWLNGSSSVNWFYQHVLGHHVYTNIDGADPDIATASNDVRRIKRSQMWRSRYAKQYIYAPIIYCFLMPKTRFADIGITYVHQRTENIRINALTPVQHAIFCGGKAFFVFHRFLVPYYLASFSLLHLFLLNTLIDFVESWTLALIFQANHVVDAVSWPLPNASGLMEADWARMQVETAQDYAHGSWLATTITGGLNYQVVHHLFPHHSQAYYPALAPIVKEVCTEFGVRYVDKKTWWEAFGGHVGLLKYLASGEEAFGHSSGEH